MSIRKVKTSTGETKWEVRVHENGRGSKRITRRFEKKVDAEVFLDEFKEEIKEKAKSPFKSSSFTDRIFREEAEYWLSDGRLRFSASHLKRVDGVFREVLPVLGNLTMDKFTPELLAKIQQREKQKGLANATVNRTTEVITAILSFSAKHRRIPFNPSKGFKKLAKSEVEMSFWDKSEAVSFLSFLNERYPKGSEQRWIYVAYSLALNTATRAGEIWGLKVMDLVEDKTSLWIRRQFNRVTLDFTPTKGKKSRYVPMHADLREEFEMLIKSKKLKADDTIFQNEKGRPVCHDNFTDRQFEKDLKAWGGRRIRFHDLRHTATTLMIATGIDIKTVKEICGHADIATTMNYVHMLSGSIGRVAQTFSIKPIEKNDEEVRADLTLLKLG